MNKKSITLFSISEKSKTKTFPYSANMVLYAKEKVILHHFVGSKTIVFPISKKFRTRLFSFSVTILFYAKTRAYHLIAFWELEDHLSWFLKYNASNASFENPNWKLSYNQLPVLKMISFLIWAPFKLLLKLII